MACSLEELGDDDDGGDEPLFADDLDDFSDDDPPPLPPPIDPNPRNNPVSSRNRDGTVLNEQDINRPTQTTAKRTRQQNNEVGGATGDDDAADGEDAPPTKKVRQPMLTLTIDKLFTPEGLPYLIKEFPKLEFKGKGHEVTDLTMLLQQYQEWANSVFPKLTFKDFCKRVEALARKNDFRSRVNSIRRASAGLLDEDGAGLDGDDEAGLDDNDGAGTSNDQTGLDNDVINERLSPEIGNSDTSVNQNENENTSIRPLNDEVDRETPSLTESLSQANNGNSQGETFIPEPWDINEEETIEDHDPYEDFPDL